MRDVSPQGLQTRQGLANDGRLTRGRIGSSSRDHVEDAGQSQVFHLRQSHRRLLRRRGGQRNACVVKVMKQVDNPGEWLGIEIVSNVPVTIARNKIG